MVDSRALMKCVKNRERIRGAFAGSWSGSGTTTPVRKDTMDYRVFSRKSRRSDPRCCQRLCRDLPANLSDPRCGHLPAQTQAQNESGRPRQSRKWGLSIGNGCGRLVLAAGAPERIVGKAPMAGSRKTSNIFLCNSNWLTEKSERMKNRPGARRHPTQTEDGRL